jgi:hypothetical protein
MASPNKWKSFDDFVNWAFGYCKITIDKDANESTTRGPDRPRLAVLDLLEQPQFRSLINDADLSELDDDGEWNIVWTL